MQKQRLTIDIYTTPHGVITVESTIPDADLHEILQKAQMSLINFEELEQMGRDTMPSKEYEEAMIALMDTIEKGL